MKWTSAASPASEKLVVKLSRPASMFRQQIIEIRLEEGHDSGTQGGHFDGIDIHTDDGESEFCHACCG